MDSPRSLTGSRSALAAVAFACLLFAFPARSQSPDAAPAFRLALFSAIYQARVEFISGSVRIGVQRAADGNLVYEYSVQAQRPWDYFIRGDLEETTKFELVDGRPRPLEYQLRNSISSNERNGSYTFDWEENRAIGIYKNRPVELDIKPGTIDRAILPLVLMNDLRNDALRDEYMILDRDEVSKIAINYEGQERIQLPYGSYDTIVLRHLSPNRKEVSILWFAPALDYLLVKMESYDNGKSVFSAELRQLMIYF